MLNSKLIVLTVAVLTIAAWALAADSDNRPTSRPAEPTAVKPEATTEAKPTETVDHPSARTRPIGRGDRPNTSLTAQQEAETLAFLKDVRPEVHKRLMKLREEDPHRYKPALSSIHQYSLRRWKNLPEDVKQATVEEKNALARIMELIHQIRHTEDSNAKAELAEQVRPAVAEHFDAYQKLREYRLAQLEGEIGRLRRELHERRRQRDLLISEMTKGWLKRAESESPESKDVGEEHKEQQSNADVPSPTQGEKTGE